MLLVSPIPFSETTDQLHLRRLPRSFYLRSALDVAPELVGKYFVRETHGAVCIGRIVEVEAYLGSKDPASHAFRGPTPRNEVMFGRGGVLYVYFTYGMHFCSNVVTGPAGRGEAVLLRAVEPVAGIPLMARNRRLKPDHTHELCNGPAKFCQAFGMGRKENGTDLCGETIWIASARDTTLPVLARSSRVGITSARARRWRFFIKGNHFVSPGRPARNA